MEIKFRGKNKKGEWVVGSLVATNRFIKHKPKQHTRHWIIQTSFGNGGWFNILKKQHIKSDTIEQFMGYEYDGSEIWLPQPQSKYLNKE